MFCGFKSNFAYLAVIYVLIIKIKQHRLYGNSSKLGEEMQMFLPNSSNYFWLTRNHIYKFLHTRCRKVVQNLPYNSTTPTGFLLKSVQRLISILYKWHEGHNIFFSESGSYLSGTHSRYAHFINAFHNRCSIFVNNQMLILNTH